MLSSAAMVLAGIGLGGINSAQALPAGSEVVGGQASITNPTQHSTLVRQDSDRAVINWNGFDVGIGESVEFQVPSTTSATLNRISSSAPSLIQGTVTSNGILYFVNPNGMIFNAGSRVTANGFVASTAAITNQTFMRSLPAVGSLRGAGSGAIELYGDIKANSIGLYAQDLMVSGNVDASNDSGVGGSVTLMADRLAAIGTVAVISASGLKDGGNINIGGNFHGTGSLVNSQFVLVESGAVISADAGTNGKGGNIVLWSDQTTIFNGKITARGGSNRGDGGLVEVSGKVNLAMNGLVDTSAAKGNAGSLLLDPGVLTIVDAATAGTVVNDATNLTEKPSDLPLAWGGNLSNSYRTWSSDLLNVQFGPGFNDGQTGTSTFSVRSTTVVANLILGNVTLEADVININRNVNITSTAGNDLIFVGRTTVGRGVQISNLGGDIKFYLHANDGPASRTAGTAVASQGDGIVFGDVASTAAGDKIILTANNIDVNTTANDGQYRSLLRDITFKAPVDFVLPAFNIGDSTGGGRLTLTTGSAVQGVAEIPARAERLYQGGLTCESIDGCTVYYQNGQSNGYYVPARDAIPEKQGYDSANINLKAAVTVTNGAEVNLDLGGVAKVVGANNLATTYGGGQVVIDSGIAMTVNNLHANSATAFNYSGAGITKGNAGSVINLTNGVLLLQEKTINGDLYVDAGGIYLTAIDGSDTLISANKVDANKQAVTNATVTGISGGTPLLNLTTDGKIIVAAQPTTTPIGRFTAGKGIKVIGALTTNFSMSFISGGSITATDKNSVKVVAGLYIGANVTSNSGTLTFTNNGNIDVGTDGTIGAGIYIDKASLRAVSSRITLTNNGSVKNVLGDEISTASDAKYSQIATVGIYLSGTSTSSSAYSFNATAKSLSIVNNGDTLYGYARQAYGVLVKDYNLETTSGAITISQNSWLRPESRSGTCTTSDNPCGHVLYIDKTSGTATADGDVFADNATARQKVADSNNANAVQSFNQTAGIEIYNSKLHTTLSTISLYRAGNLNNNGDGVDSSVEASAGNGYPVGSGIYIEGSILLTDSAANGTITINDAGLVQGYFGNIFDWGTDYPIYGVKFYGGVRGNTITAARDLTVTQSGTVESRSLGLAVGIEIDKSSLTGKNNLTIQQIGAVTAKAWNQTKADEAGNYYSASGMKFDKAKDAQNKNIYGIRMIAYGSTLADGVNLSGGGNNSLITLTTNNTDLSLGSAISNDSTRWVATVASHDRTKNSYYVTPNNQYNVTTAASLTIDLGGGSLSAHDVHLKATNIRTSYTGAAPTVMGTNTKALDAGSAVVNVLYRISRPAADTTNTGYLEVTNSGLDWHYNDGSAKKVTLNETISVSGLGLFATTVAGGAVYGGLSVKVPIHLNTGALALSGATDSQQVPGFTTTGDITISGTSYFDQSLTLDVGGTITQAVGSGKALTLKSGSKLTLQARGDILLRDTGNDIGNLGTVNGQGLVTLVNSKTLTLTSNITSRGLITFDLSAANATASVAVLKIGANIVTSGGDVDLNIGQSYGEYNNVVGANKYKFSTSGSNLYLHFSSFTGNSAITSGGSFVFDLAAPTGTAKGRYVTGGTGIVSLTGGNTAFGIYSGASAPTDSTLNSIQWQTYESLLGALPLGLAVANFNGTQDTEIVTKYTGNLNIYKVTSTTTGSIKIEVSGTVNFIGTNSFTNPLDIKVTGGSTNEIRQLAGLSATNTANNVSKITVSGPAGQLSLSTAEGKILLDGGKLDITDNSRSVTVGVNSLGKLGAVKAGTSTAAALTINFDGNLTLNGDLSGSAITIKRADAATTSTVILGANITSSGDVSIDVGTGRYLSAANFATTPAGFKWTTSGYNMTIDSLGVGLGTETTSFDLSKTTQAADGDFTVRFSVPAGKTLVIGDATVTLDAPANQVKLLASDVIDKSKITAKTTTASITADAYSLRKGVYNLGGGDLSLTATTGTITIGVAGSLATDVIQINGSLKLYTTTAAMNITQLGLNKLVVTDTLIMSATGAIALTSATGGNDIAKLGTVSATSVDINNMAGSAAALTLTGDLTVSGATTIKTKNDMTLAPTASGVTEVKIIGGGTVNFEVGGTYVDNGKQLGLYSSYTSAATNTLSSAAISVFAAAWNQTVSGTDKTIKTGGTLTIAKTYTGSATATPGAGNLWITSNNLTHGTDTIIKAIPTTFDRFKVSTLDNTTIVTGIIYTGTGTVFIDGFTSTATGSSDIKATRIVIGNGTNTGNTPSSFAGALRLTTTTITGEGVSQNPGAGLTSGNLTIDTTAAASGTAGIVLDSPLNNITFFKSLKSKGKIIINSQATYANMSDDISLTGVFTFTTKHIFLMNDITITGATATSPAASVIITAEQFENNGKTLTIAGSNDKLVKFTAGTWTLTTPATGTAAIAITGAGSKFDASSSYNGANLYITNSTNAASSTYRAGKTGDIISTIPGLNSSLPGKITINALAVVESGATQNFTAPGVSYSGAGTVTFDGFTGASGASYAISGTSFVFSGAASSFSGKLTLTASGSVSQSAGLTVTDILSITITAGTGGIDLTNGSNQLSTLGAMTSLGGISLTSGSTVSLNGSEIKAGGAFGFTGTSLTLSADTTISGATSVAVNLSGTFTDATKKLTFSSGSARFRAANWAMTATTTSIAVTSGGFNAQIDETGDIYYGGSGTPSNGRRLSSLPNSGNFIASKITVGSGATVTAPGFSTTGNFYFDGANLTGATDVYNLTAASFSFSGTNTVSGKLNLTTTTGGVSQSSGSTVTIGELTINSAGEVNLTNSGNSLGRLNAIASTNQNVRLASTTQMLLYGNINAGSDKIIYLSGTVRIRANISSNADVVLNIGDNSFDNGTGNLSSQFFNWAMGAKNLSISATTESNFSVWGAGVTGTGRITNGLYLVGNWCVGNSCDPSAGNWIGDVKGGVVFASGGNDKWTLLISSSTGTKTNDAKIEASGNLTVKAGTAIASYKNFKSGGTLTLDSTVDLTLKSVTSSGALAITATGKTITLESGATIDSGNQNNTVSITSGGLTLAGDVSSKGALSLLLGGGKYDTGGKKWDLQTNSLVFQAGSVKNGTNDLGNNDEVFNHITTSDFNRSGVKDQSPTLGATTTFTNGNDQYFTSLEVNSSEYNLLKAQLGSRIDLHPVSDLDKIKSAGIVAGFKTDSSDSGNRKLVWGVGSGTGTTLLTTAGYTVTFHNISALNLNSTILTDLTNMGKVIFAGTTRSVGSLDLSSLSSKTVVLGPDSNVSRNLKLSDTSTLVVQSGATVPNLTVTGSGTLTRLTVSGDVFIRSVIKAATLGFDNSDSGPVNLVIDNQASEIGAISGSFNSGSLRIVSNVATTIMVSNLNTGGGSISINSRRSGLTFTNVNTGGGSISVTARNGDFTATGLEAGQISYLVGNLSLTGSFAGSSGSASSTYIKNSNASYVVGDSSSDSGFKFDGSGAMILAGNLSSNGGEVAIQSTVPAVTVANDSKIFSNGGVISILTPRVDDIVNGGHGLSLDVGATGKINFSPNLAFGSRTSLGWVEIKSTRLNMQGLAITTGLGTTRTSVSPSLSDFTSSNGRRWGVGAF